MGTGIRNLKIPILNQLYLNEIVFLKSKNYFNQL